MAEALTLSSARAASAPIEQHSATGVAKRGMTVSLAICSALVAAGGHAAIPAAERQALLDLYTATNGANWTNSAGWTGAIGTECTWFGVHCLTGGSNVDAIDLHNNWLEGTLPASLINLSVLQSLDVGSNSLRGSLPDLSPLLSLGVLKVGGNQFSGALPNPPPGLLIGQSALCPNTLNTSGSGNAAWDLATGQSPWWNACPITFLDTFEDLPPPHDRCAIGAPPAGFFRTTRPRVWTDIFVGRSWPASNGQGFLTSNNGGYTAVAFTTPASWSASFIRWEQAQQTVVGIEEGTFKYYITISECPGDFRLGSTTPAVPTDAPVCKSIRKNGFGGWDQFLTIFINSTGVSGSSCGLLPNKTYYLNMIVEDPRVQDTGGNFDPADPSNCTGGASSCGVRLFTDQ